ncbi:MAG: hypothetical protein DMG41_01415 [Acidobacteria bacterium]|nr:MAG: hypothetical protein DMG41_01415 [Acidobacteriota bacterium]
MPMAVEIAPVHRGVVHVMDAVASLRKILFHGAQQAGFAAAGISCDHSRGAAFQRSLQTLTRGSQDFRIEHLRGRKVLAERKPRQTVDR